MLHCKARQANEQSFKVVNHSKQEQTYRVESDLPHISGIVKDVCKKHGVYYHESTGFRQAFGKYLAHMKELSVAEIIAEHVSDHHHTTAKQSLQPHHLRHRQCSQAASAE